MVASSRLDEIKKQAELLARDNQDAEPSIQAVYWFPDDREVRLVEITPVVPLNEDDQLHPTYYPPSLEDQLPAPTMMTMIRPEEWRQLRLPPGWSYDLAILIANGAK